MLVFRKLREVSNRNAGEIYEEMESGISSWTLKSIMILRTEYSFQERYSYCPK